MSAMLRQMMAAILLAGGLSLPVWGQSASTGRALRSTPPRGIDANLAAIREHLQAGNVPAALPLFDQLLRDVDDSAGPLQAAAEQTIARLTPLQREQLEGQVAGRARDELTSALANGDDEQIARALRRFGWTREGAAGWLAVCLRAQDRGLWKTAEAAARRVLSHHAASPGQRATALLLAVDSLIATENPTEAHVLWDHYRGDLSSVPVREAGRARPLADRIAERLPQGKATAVTDAAASLPVLVARWQRELRPSSPVSEGLALLTKPFRAHGAVSFPVQQPLVVGDTVFVRGIDQLLACDLQTGEKRWRAAQPEFSRLQDHPALLENTMYRNAILDSLWRREQVDTVFSSITTDAERVFVVEEPSDQGRQMMPPRRNPDERDDELQPAISNHLAAYDVATGDLTWRIGGGTVSPSYPLGGVYFLGPPTAVDDTAYGVGQRGSELGLYAIDSRRGELLWWVSLGQVERPLAGDLLRRGTACPVLWDRGLLICPTTAGVIAAVDATTRQIRWLARYPDRQREIVLPQPGAIRPRSRPESWWDGWRSVSLWPVGEQIVGVSPESHEWLVIDRADGSIVRRGPRSKAIAIAGITNQTLVLTESTAIRGVDLETGKTRWRTVTGDISGQGIIAGEHLLQPVAEGTLAAIRLQDGQLDWLRGGETLPMGRLVQAGNDWLLAGPNGLCALASRATAANLIETQPMSPGGPAREVRLARLRLQEGQAREAWERLSGQMNDSKRDALLAAGLAWLEQEPGIWKSLADRLQELSLTPDERYRARLALIEASSAAGDQSAAMTFALDGLEERPEGIWRVEGDPLRHVRRDRLLQGWLDRLLRNAEPAVRAAQEQQLQQRLDQMVAKKDPFAVQGWLDRLGPLSWARARTLEHSEAAFLGRSVLETELRLLELSGARESPLFVTGRLRLANFLQEAGFPRDAMAALNDLELNHPGTLTDDGKTVAETIDRLKQDPKWASAFRPEEDLWPVRKPWTESFQRRNEQVYQFGADVYAEPGSLTDRLDIGIDRQGRWVQFAGDGQTGPWRVELPSSSSPFRYVYFRHATWGWGRLALMRVGSELFAITPLNSRGEPQAQVLWTVDTAATVQPMSDQVDVVPYRDKAGVRAEELSMFDPYGREIAAVGPVRPRYLCYREQAVLRALETSTGAVLWERYDLPDGAITFGDDDLVAVWQPTTSRLELLSAIDGRTLAERSWTTSVDDLLQISGTRAWIIERGPETAVCLRDVVTEETHWRTAWTGEATPFLLDSQTIGLLDPRGVLAVLSAETGGLMGEPLTVDCPAAVDRVAVARDAERWYITWTPRLDNIWRLQKGQPRGSFRTPFIDGTLLAINRRQVQIEWRRRLENEPFPIDQSHNAPVLWQIWKLPADGQNTNQLGDGRVQLIDKRTGELIFQGQSSNLQPYLALQSNPESQLVDLLLSSEVVRLHYRGEPPPPEEDKKEP